MQHTYIETKFSLEEMKILSTATWYVYRNSDDIEHTSPAYNCGNDLIEHPCYGYDYYRSATSEKMCKVNWLKLTDKEFDSDIAELDLWELFS